MSGKSRCNLQWKPPTDDGGSRVSHYVVEKRDCAKGNDYWVPVTDAVRVRCFKNNFQNNIFF